MINESRDLSQVKGMNPTKWLHQHYDQLKIMPFDQLGPLLINSVPEMGFGKREKGREFANNVMRYVEREDTEGLWGYITYFLVNGIDKDLKVIRVGRGCNEDVQNIASVITEDVNAMQFTSQQLALKKLVETGTNFRLVLR